MKYIILFVYYIVIHIVFQYLTHIKYIKLDSLMCASYSFKIKGGRVEYQRVVLAKQDVLKKQIRATSERGYAL